MQCIKGCCFVLHHTHVNTRQLACKWHLVIALLLCNLYSCLSRTYCTRTNAQISYLDTKSSFFASPSFFCQLRQKFTMLSSLTVQYFLPPLPSPKYWFSITPLSLIAFFFLQVCICTAQYVAWYFHLYKAQYKCFVCHVDRAVGILFNTSVSPVMSKCML